MLLSCSMPGWRSGRGGRGLPRDGWCQRAATLPVMSLDDWATQVTHWFTRASDGSPTDVTLAKRKLVEALVAKRRAPEMVALVREINAAVLMHRISA